jgi:hypothetical protein
MAHSYTSISKLRVPQRLAMIEIGLPQSAWLPAYDKNRAKVRRPPGCGVKIKIKFEEVANIFDLNQADIAV